jgi:hypothetical protein
MTSTGASPVSCGVLFAATGRGYVELAERAARSVRRHCPGLAIDLFTDLEIASPAFDRVVVMEDVWHRSRIDAMMATRFDRTLHLDADLLVIADIRDVFDVLERFDMALAHDQGRNSAWCHKLWRKPLPAAFPQFNGGVIAYRRSEPVLAALANWRDAVRTEKMKYDQAALREILWESELRLATLPEEYNLIYFDTLSRWSTVRAAPRIIHSRFFHLHFTGTRKSPITTLDELLGPAAAARLPELLAADRDLAAKAGRKPREPVGRWKRHARATGIAARLIRAKLGRRLRLP